MIRLKLKLQNQKAACKELQSVADLLAKPGRLGVIDSRPKILAMLKAGDEATRSDAGPAVQVLRRSAK